jgi:hypothetical protein
MRMLDPDMSVWLGREGATRMIPNGTTLWEYIFGVCRRMIDSLEQEHVVAGTGIIVTWLGEATSIETRSANSLLGHHLERRLMKNNMKQKRNTKDRK